jgi:hypothetical protein
MPLDEFRRRALVLHRALKAASQVPLPPRLQAVADRYREDLEVVLACSEPELAELLRKAPAPSFDALRGLIAKL